MSALITRRSAALGLLAPVGAPLLSACGHKSSAALPDDMSMGNPQAKVHMIEYASVACPICGRWYKEVWPAFKAKYVDTGQVYYTLREMLVGGSGEVLIAASGFLLARCSGPDRYFKVVDAIFKSQPTLFDDPRNVLLNIAKSEGMSEDQFDACVKNEAALKALSDRVQKNSAEGHVDATPTFVINGVALAPGYHSLSEMDAAIAAAKAK